MLSALAEETLRGRILFGYILPLAEFLPTLSIIAEETLRGRISL
jgi:hypothetical protein